MRMDAVADEQSICEENENKRIGSRSFSIRTEIPLPLLNYAIRVRVVGAVNDCVLSALRWMASCLGQFWSCKFEKSCSLYHMPSLSAVIRSNTKDRHPIRQSKTSIPLNQKSSRISFDCKSLSIRTAPRCYYHIWIDYKSRQKCPVSIDREQLFNIVDRMGRFVHAPQHNTQMFCRRSHDQRSMFIRKMIKHEEFLSISDPIVVYSNLSLDACVWRQRWWRGRNHPQATMTTTTT